ncbi:acyl-ACP--UDP-N-acetylglucosamine O-acyltransferase [Luteolibacter sp. LG18]|uniref:acyl-ACP--UDP-N-acetylglucosamine O-acyltransferase n=1 Tax=Luteolibacter sp. LG18 TaxID=2819286 RepID=UPI002B2E613D|nr:acyl-[acyl-carrier-protein]--UDP-N-acetylglucosamine O-acyltransferase [Luteolibacter sp. LG18]
MPQIHPSALVSPEAVIADDVVVGPFTVIEAGVKLAAGVQIAGHVCISGDTEIGEGSAIGWGSVVGADPQDLSFDPATPSGVRIGPRNTLREYVTIHRGSKPGAYTIIGTGNFLMTGVHLAHDVQMGDNNVLANNVLLAGHIRMGNRVFLGGGAGLHQFIRVGDFAMVQGNSAISQDVPPYCVGYGSNQIAGLNVVGLRRAGFDAETRAEIKAAAKLLLLSRLPISEALAEAGQREWSPAARLLIDAVASPSKKGVIVR